MRSIKKSVIFDIEQSYFLLKKININLEDVSGRKSHQFPEKCLEIRENSY
jgi:hypothetical protein